MLSSNLLPLLIAQVDTSMAVALWATPVVLVFLYFLVRMDANKHSEELRSTLGQLDHRQAHLEEQMDRLVGVLEKIRETSVSNNQALVATLEELAYTEVEEEVIEASPAASRAKSVAPAKPAPKEEKPASANVETAPVTATVEKEAAVPAEVSDDPIAEGRRLIDNMEDDHPANLLAARDAFNKAINGAQSAAAYNGLSETLFWLGELAKGDKDKEKWHEEGVVHGKKAVSLLPNDASAHMWYAANMGAHGVARGIMSSLFYLGDIDKHGTKALELDETFFHAAPLRLMGRFYHQCPGWPVGKGDMGKATDMLQRAVKLAPEFLVNHLYLAEVYLAKRKKREAKAVLEEMLAVKEYALMPKYMEGMQGLGRKLLAKC